MSGKPGGKPRRNPGVRGLSPHLKEMRRKDAEERQAAYDKLSPKERLARLDAKFGAGKGAKKERAKLAKRLAKAS